MINPETSNPGIVITFNPALTIKTIAGIPIKVSTISIVKMVDNPVKKTVTIYTNQATSYVLWSGTAYDAIGEWTDADVKTRLTQLLTTGK